MKSVKWIIKHIVPVMLSFAIVICVVVYDHEKVRATGMEEVLYYTYWDLVNSLFFAEGYSPTIDSKALQDEANRVSGEQMWEAFKYDVSRQFDGVEYLADELEQLALTATLEGIKISPELFKALGAAFDSLYGSSVSASQTYEELVDQYAPVNASYPYRYANQLNFNDTILNYGFATTKPVTLCYYDVFSSDCQLEDYRSGIVYSTEPFKLYVNSDRIYDSICCNGFYYRSWGSSGNLASGASAFGKVSIAGGVRLANFEYGWTFEDYISNILAVGGDVASTSLDGIISATKVADPVDVKDDTIPWVVSTQYWTVERTETDTGSSSGSGSDDEDDKKKDRLPVVIPFVWPSTDPDNTEEETESESESESETTGTGTDTDPDTDTDTDTDIDEETLTDTVDSVLSNGGKITQLFPFCIPFDIVSMIKGMKSAKKAPVWHFKYYFKPIDYTFEFTVDMSDYEQYIKIFRAGFVIFYVITLMLLTIRYSSGIVKD